MRYRTYAYEPPVPSGPHVRAENTCTRRDHNTSMGKMYAYMKHMNASGPHVRVETICTCGENKYAYSQFEEE